MSLILDALRKSEAERRRGQVPDLHTGPAPGFQPARDGPPAWLWMTLGLAAVVVLALALWTLRNLVAVPSGAAGAPETRPDIETTVQSPIQTALAETTGPAAEPAIVATASEQGTITPERGSTSPPAAAEDTASPGTPPSRAQPSPLAPRTDAPALGAPLPPTAGVPAQDVPAVTSAAPSEARTPAVPPAEATANSTMPATPVAQPGPMLLSDLSVAQREQLPPLRMSMHLWAPDQRFAIIDGARVGEGDRVGGAVVEAITADGVFIVWQGYRLYLPVR